MARTFANRFNRLYTTHDYFPEPYAFNFSDKLVKIPGLDGKGKMGKSEGDANVVNLADEPEVIRKKVMRAVTDSGPTCREPGRSLVENSKPVRPDESSFHSRYFTEHFDKLYNNSCQIRYGDLKETISRG